jgi:hypothetical protein
MKKILYTCLLVSPILFITSCEEDIEGCTDSLACNYNYSATADNGSCDYPVLGFDCDGNEVQFYVGQMFNVGIVFYIDTTGEHGLVAAKEDIGSYEWGCNGVYVSGADGLSIGTGLQNTLDIISECIETPIAASEALAYESGGYSDWYLPSLDELKEMYNTIGPGTDNIGCFENSEYWSSSEFDNFHQAWIVDFYNGYDGTDTHDYLYKVRPIRSF